MSADTCDSESREHPTSGVWYCELLIAPPANGQIAFFLTVSFISGQFDSNYILMNILSPLFTYYCKNVVIDIFKVCVYYVLEAGSQIPLPSGSNFCYLYHPPIHPCAYSIHRYFLGTFLCVGHCSRCMG